MTIFISNNRYQIILQDGAEALHLYLAWQTKKLTKCNTHAKCWIIVINDLEPASASAPVPVESQQVHHQGSTNRETTAVPTSEDAGSSLNDSGASSGPSSFESGSVISTRHD